jgi:hypothetical protein
VRGAGSLAQRVLPMAKLTDLGAGDLHLDRIGLQRPRRGL